MNARTIAFTMAMAALHGACGHGHHGPAHDPYTHEIEPNNTFVNAQGIGPIFVGEQVLVRGHIEDFGPDLYDGFAFASGTPMDIEFALHADDPHADFDVMLFDPYTQTTVASWESAFNPERGTFSVGSAQFEFHLVVTSFHGAGAYTLEVRGAPLTFFGDGTYALTAEGTARAGDGAVNWHPYGQITGAMDTEIEDAVRREPLVQVTTLILDPETGRLLEIRTLRLRAE